MSYKQKMRPEDQHTGHSTLEQHMKNIRFLRSLYTLLAPILLIALIWTSLILFYWTNIGTSIASHWGFGIAAGVIVVLLIFAAMFARSLSELPLNWIVYFLFMTAFAYFASFICTFDKTFILYFTLWVLTFIVFAFHFYTHCSGNYIPAIEAFLIAFGSGLFVLVAFIVFTTITFYWLVLAYFATAVYGFYLGYSLRTSVMYGLFEEGEDDPVSGAVKIWGESCLVFCRIGELFGKSFHKTPLKRNL